MFDATDAAARRSWVTSPYRSVEGNCFVARSEEHTSELQSLAYLVCRLIISKKHTSELQSLAYLVCRLLLEKKKMSPNELVTPLYSLPRVYNPLIVSSCTTPTIQ